MSSSKSIISPSDFVLISIAVTFRECLRVDPCLEIPEAALCDIFYEADIRRSINNWIQGTDGVNLINKLFALVPPQLGPVTISRAEMEEKIKQAQLLDVPKPDPDTVNANYNPELDRKRPTNIDDYLRLVNTYAMHVWKR